MCLTSASVQVTQRPLGGVQQHGQPYRCGIDSGYSVSTRVTQAGQQLVNIGSGGGMPAEKKAVNVER
jgi:hypothetical protein